MDAVASSSFAKALGCHPPWIAGVVNVTPDSFSDGGECFDENRAVDHCLQLKEDGAHILDIGGEATGPGSTPVGEAEEWRRIGGVIKRAAPVSFVSVDTYKASIAAKALEAGARMINDVSGLRADRDLARVAAKHGAYLAIMFSLESGAPPHVSGEKSFTGDVIAVISEFLRERIAFAKSQGVAEDRIIIDPGMGRYLGTAPEPSWTVLRELAAFKRLGRPVMIGVSRKGFLGGPLAGRDPISQLVAIAAIERGADVVRTHNVAMLRNFWETWQRVSVLS
jgi:dihydropteroate synthase